VTVETSRYSAGERKEVQNPDRAQSITFGDWFKYFFSCTGLKPDNESNPPWLNQMRGKEGLKDLYYLFRRSAPSISIKSKVNRKPHPARDLAETGPC